MAALWMHRPTDEEHEALLAAMKEGDYPSVSAFVREAVMRLVYVENKQPLFTRLADSLTTAEKLLAELGEQIEEYERKVGDGQ